MKLRLYLFALATLTVAATAYQVHVHSAPTHTSLTSFVPQDALLSIESPDFADLLHRWSNSSQSKAWLKSDNDKVFQNSRLYGRLTDAQNSFEAVAGLPGSVDLLSQIAGKESVFAWYDIGKLEFLYITRMSAAQASRCQLMQSRGSFQRRHAGNSDFYIKTSGSDFSTVAFAQVNSPSGDFLLLATREDLIANALELMAGHEQVNSVQSEPWFQDASSALAAESAKPALHMVLNLDRIADDPHFRSYWVQRNITWTRQFRSAASDLYLESDHFHEERALIPKTTLQVAPSIANLSALAELAPADTGVFRAVATQDPAVAVTALQEKLLGANTAAKADSANAPDPDLDGPQSGSSSDLEVRIDALPPMPASASSELLRQVFRQAGLDAMMTLSSAQNPSAEESLWIPIHSAVVLHAANSWDAPGFAVALQQVLRGSLTASDIGINFHTKDVGGFTVYSVNGPRPLFFAISSSTARGNLILLADETQLLRQLLQNLVKPVADPNASATIIAAFNHASQRQPYQRLVSLLDGKPQRQSTSDGGGSTEVATRPDFFSGNIRSLSDTFSDLSAERFIERTNGGVLRETVDYEWPGEALSPH